MQKITHLPYLAFFLSVFVLASCGKDDDDTTTPNDPTNPSTQKCIVTSASEVDGSDSNEILFEYNGQRQISKVSFKENGVLESYTEVFEYNSGGRISKITEMDGTTVDGFSTYTYNSDGLLTRREYHYSNSTGSPITLQGIRIYEYDSNKKLIRYNVYDGATPTVIEAYSTYSYPSGNTATETYFTQTGSAPPSLASTTNYTFDDKKGLQQLLGVFWEDEFISEHNITREEYISASGGTPDITNFTYEYNAEGLPTKITSNSSGFNPEVLNVNYNCN